MRCALPCTSGGAAEYAVREAFHSHSKGASAYENTGILRIQAFGARQSSPIEGVLVTVSGNGFTAQRITDETGTAADLSIEAPSCALSLQEDNTIRPYAVVDLTAAKAGFRTVRIQGVQIFAGQVTLAQPEMIPETEGDRDVVNPPIVIPEHSLFTGDGGSGPDPMENCVPRVLDRVIIPKTSRCIWASLRHPPAM